MQASANTLPSLPSTPAHNTLGEQLRDVLHPYTPEGEELIPIRIEIDGAAFEPPVDHQHSDKLLWNALDSSLTPEGFAKLTCEEVGLPASFEEMIVAQIRKAIKDNRTARAGGGAASATVGADGEADVAPAARR